MAANPIARSKIYQVQTNVRAIQNDIQIIRQVDAETEKQQRMWGWIMGLSIAATIACFIYGATQDMNVAAWQVAIFGAFAVLAIVALFTYFLHRKENVENRRYELVDGTLDLLKTDMAGDAQIKLKMDLRPPNAREKYVRKGKAGHWNVKYYHDPWLIMEGRFLDGTAFHLEVAEQFQARSRWKRGRSGKMKHKTKTKSASRIALRLKPKTSKHQHLVTLAQDAVGAVQLPPWTIFRGVAVDEGGLVLKSGAKTPWTAPGPAAKDGVQWVATMFLSLYQILNLSRSITKSSGGAS